MHGRSPTDRTGDLQAVTYDRMKIEITHLEVCDTRTIRVPMTNWRLPGSNVGWMGDGQLAVAYSRCVDVNIRDLRAKNFFYPHSVEIKRLRESNSCAQNDHGRDRAYTSTQGYAKPNAWIPTNKQLMQGSGMKPGTKPRGCGTCGGSGVVTQVARTPLGMLQQQSACPQCQVTLINPVDFSSS